MQVQPAQAHPAPLPRDYPANLWLCYRGVRYRPAALKLFVERGGWGRELSKSRQAESPTQDYKVPINQSIY